jgi:hypothetical protein
MAQVDKVSDKVRDKGAMAAMDAKHELPQRGIPYHRPLDLLHPNA